MSVVARFDSAENDALESLVELYGALLQSIAEISKEYCEHGNRVVPLIQDVISGKVTKPENPSLTQTERSEDKPVRGPLVSTTVGKFQNYSVDLTVNP